MTHITQDLSENGIKCIRTMNASSDITIKDYLDNDQYRYNRSHETYAYDLPQGIMVDAIQ